MEMSDNNIVKDSEKLIQSSTITDTPSIITKNIVTTTSTNNSTPLSSTDDELMTTSASGESEFGSWTLINDAKSKLNVKNKTLNSDANEVIVMNDRNEVYKTDATTIEQAIMAQETIDHIHNILECENLSNAVEIGETNEPHLDSSNDDNSDRISIINETDSEGRLSPHPYISEQLHNFDHLQHFINLSQSTMKQQQQQHQQKPTEMKTTIQSMLYHPNDNDGSDNKIIQKNPSLPLSSSSESSSESSSASSTASSQSTRSSPQSPSQIQPSSPSLKQQTTSSSATANAATHHINHQKDENIEDPDDILYRIRQRELQQRRTEQQSYRQQQRTLRRQTQTPTSNYLFRGYECDFATIFIFTAIIIIVAIFNIVNDYDLSRTPENRLMNIDKRLIDIEMQNNLLRAEIDILTKQISHLNTLNDKNYKNGKNAKNIKEKNHKNYNSYDMEKERASRRFKAWSGMSDNNDDDDDDDDDDAVDITKDDLKKPYNCLNNDICKNKNAKGYHYDGYLSYLDDFSNAVDNMFDNLRDFNDNEMDDVEQTTDKVDVIKTDKIQKNQDQEHKIYNRHHHHHHHHHHKHDATNDDQKQKQQQQQQQQQQYDKKINITKDENEEHAKEQTFHCNEYKPEQFENKKGYLRAKYQHEDNNDDDHDNHADYNDRIGYIYYNDRVDRTFHDDIDFDDHNDRFYAAYQDDYNNYHAYQVDDHNDHAYHDDDDDDDHNDQNNHYDDDDDDNFDITKNSKEKFNKKKNYYKKLKESSSKKNYDKNSKESSLNDDSNEKKRYHQQKPQTMQHPNEKFERFKKTSSREQQQPQQKKQKHKRNGKADDNEWHTKLMKYREKTRHQNAKKNLNNWFIERGNDRDVIRNVDIHTT